MPIDKVDISEPVLGCKVVLTSERPPNMEDVCDMR